MKNNPLKHKPFCELKDNLNKPNTLEQDLSFIHELARRSTRWINCSICGKLITKKSMSSHYRSFHDGDTE